MPTSGRKLHVLLGATLICLFAAGFAEARSHRRKPRSEPQQTGGTFAYYLLSLSYAPDFCAQPQGNKDPRECGAGRRVGFVVHGLWPQGDSGRGPERCGPASPVSQDLVRLMLNYMPTESLIQHEWANHGTCSGLSAADYFAAVRKTLDSVTIPGDLKAPGMQLTLTPAQIEGKLAAANPRFPKDAFRTSCYGAGELQEARICFNKDLSPRACSASAGECGAPSVVMLPVR
ncbi:MAG: ribonuclease T(2) [Acidobacteriota bacterium]|nr:ribonuclease T(2) [Acidobacteriota bacterium]